MNFDNEKRFILKEMDHVFKGAILAGGALTATFSNSKIADFDLYFRSKDDFVKALDEAYGHGFWCVSLTSRAITFKKNDTLYQFMYFRFFERISDIFASFDFTCCMAAMDLSEASPEFHFHSRFLADISRRELVFNGGTAFPIASGMRVFKYIERGYTMRKKEWLKLATACAFRKISSWAELSDQIGGSYGDVVTMDTTRPFTLENACSSLDGAHVESKSDDPPPTSSDAAMDAVSLVPATSQEAYHRIFGGQPL